MSNTLLLQAPELSTSCIFPPESIHKDVASSADAHVSGQDDKATPFNYYDKIVYYWN